MRIIHIVQSLDIGGAEHLVVQMAAEQVARGMEAAIICLGGEGGLAGKARAAGVHVSSMMHKGGFAPGLVFRLARRLREVKADIVHTHNMGPLLYGSIAARLAGCRCINTRHGRAAKKVMSFIWNLNDFVVAVSEDAKTRMLEFNRIRLEKVRVIRNGIEVGGKTEDCRLQTADWEGSEDGGRRSKVRDQRIAGLRDCEIEGGRGQIIDHRQVKVGGVETQQPTTDNQQLTTGNNFVVATVGRLSWEKNQALLLRAFAEFRMQVAESTLVIVGDGAERDNLEKLAEELVIGDNIKFMGYRDDVPELMSRMDVFVLPSLEEGLSLTLLEAMASSLPVIATDAGGNGEAVVDGETGIIVPSGDTDAMAVAMLRIHDDRALAALLGAAGRRRVEECFSLKTMVDEYMKLYERANGRGGA